MSPFPVSPVRSSSRFRGEVESRLGPQTSAISVSKVKGLVLARIGFSGGRSALLPSVTAPRILIDLLAPFSIAPFEERGRLQREFFDANHRKRAKARKSSGKPGVPIGLRRKGNFPFSAEGRWINPFNALMQFLLGLPGFSDSFFFAPRSFHPFQDFIDQYKADQQENRAVSSANISALIRCAMRKLPHSLFHGGYDLYGIFRALTQALFPFPQTSPANIYFPQSLAFHPEWHLVWDVREERTLEERIREKELPPEILVSVRGVEETPSSLIKRQFFAASDASCYDLDAFIELRPDGPSASLIAYLKVEGSWYQCDDDRIAHLRSNCLNVPLCRGILLHYKRIEFGRC